MRVNWILGAYERSLQNEGKIGRVSHAAKWAVVGEKRGKASGKASLEREVVPWW